MEIQVRGCARHDDEELSLEIYNEVWPRDAVTMDEVDSFKRSALAHADHLGLVDGDPVGSGFVAIQPQRPNVGHAGVTVLPRARRRGVGTALYRELSRWCATQGLEAIEAPVEEDDDESLRYAQRRGFVEVERNGRMVLELAGHDPLPIAPPTGVEIVSWAGRPDLARFAT